MDTSPNYHWFKGYTRTFLTGIEEDDNHINLKINHSLRVAEHSRNITLSLMESEENVFIAQVCGLYHDIARFEQYRRYKTFQDSSSIDHGDYGSLLFKSLEIPELSSETADIISYSIQFHNKKSIPEHSDRKTYFTRIVRDADKLDIFKVLIDEFNAESPSLKLNLPWNDTFSPEIIDAIYSRSQVSYGMRKSVNDMKLVMLNWLFDMSFGYSLEHVEQMNYIEQIGNMLPDHDEIRKVIDFVQREINNDIRSKKEAGEILLEPS